MNSIRNTTEYWGLAPLHKYSEKGVEHSLHPREVIRKNYRQVSGILDSGQCYMGSRPSSFPLDLDSDNIQNDIWCQEQASILMEAAEHYSARFCQYDVVVGSYRQLSQQGHDCVHVDEIIVPALCGLSDDLVLEWVCGYDIVNARETFVPLNAVMCPYAPQQGPRPFYSSTNGLSSGATRIEALCHALCEVIERDAQAIFAAQEFIRPMVRELLGLSREAEDLSPKAQAISLGELPQPTDILVKQIQQSGLSVLLRNLTATAGIATIDCTILERSDAGNGQAYRGSGAHPDARVALLRAVSEAKESHLTWVQGDSEGRPKIRRLSHGEIDQLFDGAEFDWIAFRELPSTQNERIDQDVELLLSRLPASGLDRVIVFDMTRPEIEIPVVRVVVPSAETWHIFHLLTGRGCLGPRIAGSL